MQLETAFPVELQYHILGCLDVKSIRTLSSVSKSLHRLTSAYFKNTSYNRKSVALSFSKKFFTSTEKEIGEYKKLTGLLQDEAMKLLDESDRMLRRLAAKCFSETFSLQELFYLSEIFFATDENVDFCKNKIMKIRQDNILKKIEDLTPYLNDIPTMAMRPRFIEKDFDSRLIQAIKRCALEGLPA